MQKHENLHIISIRPAKSQSNKSTIVHLSSQKLFHPIPSQFSLHRLPQVIHYRHQHLSSYIAELKSYLVESSHRFISTSDLHLEKRCLLSITSFFRTLHLSLVCIVPSSRPSDDVLFLLPREGFALIESLLDDKLVWACLAFESIYRIGGLSLTTCSGSGRRDCEDIAAGGADWIEELVLSNFETCVLGQ